MEKHEIENSPVSEELKCQQVENEKYMEKHEIEESLKKKEKLKHST